MNKYDRLPRREVPMYPIEPTNKIGVIESEEHNTCQYGWLFGVGACVMFNCPPAAVVEVFSVLASVIYPQHVQDSVDVNLNIRGPKIISLVIRDILGIIKAMEAIKIENLASPTRDIFNAYANGPEGTESIITRAYGASLLNKLIAEWLVALSAL